MNRKAIPYLFLILLALTTFFVVRWRDGVEAQTVAEQKATDIKRNRGFDRRTSFIEYTKHALCRMDCRLITQKDVEEIMSSGSINYRKSNVKQTPCPVYAVQGTTSDGQKLRAIFAQCDDRTKVVTVYDLEKEFECFCPGDEKKKK